LPIFNPFLGLEISSLNCVLGLLSTQTILYHS
jgi:hypothetical protein